jgi:hypothetical protein
MLYVKNDLIKGNFYTLYGGPMVWQDTWVYIVVIDWCDISYWLWYVVKIYLIVITSI